MAKIVFFDLIDIDAVIADFAVRNVVKAVDQIGDRGFSRARRAYKPRSPI